MSLLDRLRAVDEQHVPRLAWALRTMLDRAAAVRPPGAGRLQRLDERYAARGPLARVRRTPSLALGVVAVLLLTGALAVADRSDDPVATASGPRTALGPGAGDAVEDYLAIAAARLGAAAREGEQPVTALVSLDPALPAGQAQALTPGLDVQRAYTQGSLEIVGVDGLQRLADEPAGPDGCPCVVALLLRGPGVVLASLPGQQGVRAVEATAAEASDVDVRLLLPGVRGTVSSTVRAPGEGEGS